MVSQAKSLLLCTLPKGFYLCYALLSSMLAHHLLTAQCCFLCFLKSCPYVSPRPLTLRCMAVQARAAAFVKTLKREGIERKDLQATGGILIKINKLNCSAFQAKQWETNCLPAEWEASSQTAYQQAVNETLVFWESLLSRHKVSKRTNNCMVITHPPFQAPPRLPGAKVSLSLFWSHIILRCLYILVFADMQSGCGAQNRNALKCHLFSFLTFLYIPLLHSSIRMNFLFLLLAMLNVIFRVFTSILHR